MQESVWVAPVAALAGVALTYFGDGLRQRTRDKRAAAAARSDARREVYIELLTSTAMMITSISDLRSISGASSKWFHGWNQLLKTAPATPTLVEILDRFHRPTERFMAAWSKSLLLFEQDEIDAVSKLVAALDWDMATPQDDPESAEARIGAARREFAEFARTKIGEVAVTIGPRQSA